MSEPTYIYGEREWVTTGREAVKRAKRSGAKDVSMVEIRPVHQTDLEDTSNNKWVKMEDLYYVIADIES